MLRVSHPAAKPAWQPSSCVLLSMQLKSSPALPPPGSSQGRGATCPMCQASVALRVRYRMPWHHVRQEQARPDGVAGAADAVVAAAAEGIPGLQALAAAMQVGGHVGCSAGVQFLQLHCV